MARLAGAPRRLMWLRRGWEVHGRGGLLENEALGLLDGGEERARGRGCWLHGLVGAQVDACRVCGSCGVWHCGLPDAGHQRLWGEPREESGQRRPLERVLATCPKLKSTALPQQGTKGGGAGCTLPGPHLATPQALLLIIIRPRQVPQPSRTYRPTPPLSHTHAHPLAPCRTCTRVCSPMRRSRAGSSAWWSTPGSHSSGGNEGT